MSFKRWLKDLVRPVARPLRSALFGARQPVLAAGNAAPETTPLEVEVLAFAAARALTLPSENRGRPHQPSGRVGVITSAKALAETIAYCERLDADLEVVVVHAGCAMPPTKPNVRVRHVGWDATLQATCRGRFAAIVEVSQLYRDLFRLSLAPDRALLLAQQMGYWPAVRSAARYASLHLVAEMVRLGPFVPMRYTALREVRSLPHDVSSCGPQDDSLDALLIQAGWAGAEEVRSLDDGRRADSHGRPLAQVL